MIPVAAMSAVPIAGPAVASVTMDETAFAAFYAQTARPLRAYLARSLGDPSLADDLSQEAYVRFLSSGPKADDEHCRASLFRIATNLMRDHYRRRRSTAELTERDGRTADQGDPGKKSDVARALGGLGVRDRQMLWLAYVEGSSHAEIARALGLKAASLKSMLFRARRRMAERLRELGYHPGEEDS